MKITILKIPNPDCRSEKLVIFHHEEGLGEFREKLRNSLRETLIKKYAGLGASVLCWDELFADIQGEFQKDQPCHCQTLDIDLLVGHIPRTVKILPRTDKQ